MDCPICLNQFQASQMIITSCNHRFCQECLQGWLFNHSTCPICRHNIDDSLSFENSVEIIDLSVEEDIDDINDFNNIIVENNQNINNRVLNGHLNLNDPHIINQMLNNLRHYLMTNDIEEFENMLVFIFEHNLINTIELLNNIYDINNINNINNNNINNNNINIINNININSFLLLVNNYDNIYNG